MRRALAIATIVVAGCAGSNREPQGRDTGAIISEVGDPGRRARAHTELGAMYYGVGNLGVALEELRIAVAAEPKHAQAHGLLGLVYMDLRETRLAEESFDRALRLMPEDPDINHNYGWFLCQSGRQSESIKYFLKAVRNPLYPTPGRSYSAAGICSVRSGNVKDADEFFERALKLDPNDPQSLMQLSEIRFRQGALEEARKLVARHNRLVEPTAAALWLALRIERRLGERGAESNLGNQLRRRFPASPEYQALQRGQYD